MKQKLVENWRMCATSRGFWYAAVAEDGALFHYFISVYRGFTSQKLGKVRWMHISLNLSDYFGLKSPDTSRGKGGSEILVFSEQLALTGLPGMSQTVT